MSVVGTPASGFVVKGVPKADPDKVRVRGPKSAVMVLQHARADAFDVRGLGEGIHIKQLAIDKPPPRFTYDMSSVKVVTEIARENVERPFTKLPVAVTGVAKAKTQPAEVDVRLVCPPEVLRGLRPEQVVPRTDVKSTAASGSEAMPVIVTVDKCEAIVTPSTVMRPLVKTRIHHGGTGTRRSNAGENCHLHLRVPVSPWWKFSAVQRSESARAPRCLPRSPR